MKKYLCPYAVRQAEMSFIICAYIMEKGVDYSKIQNAARIFCAHQHYCPETKRAENTEMAKQCYEYHSLETNKKELI
jgi:hypothetical protein